jgi:hypothetical protein
METSPLARLLPFWKAQVNMVLTAFAVWFTIYAAGAKALRSVACNARESFENPSPSRCV